MKGNERREQLLDMLINSKEPITGKQLASTFGVSRQVIVQDIALLRAKEIEIVSTTTGYIVNKVEKGQETRVFKVVHTDEQTRDELQTIIDLGGKVEDVFIYHRMYGVVRGDLMIASRRDIDEFMKDLSSGNSSLLKNVTSNYHYHTVAAPTKAILDIIQEKLYEKGYLAKLQDYEPIDFWKVEE